MDSRILAHDWISLASEKLFSCRAKHAEINKKNATEKCSEEHAEEHSGEHTEEDCANDTGNLTVNFSANCVEALASDELNEKLFSSPSGINSQEEARREATIIFCHCLDIDKVQLHLKKQFPVSAVQLARLDEYLVKRAEGIPLAYIFGIKEFFGIDFIVDANTLIPRPETEFLVEEALSFCDNKALTFLDLGCGSGCIALSLLKNRSNWNAILVDVVPETLEMARKNAMNLNVEERANFVLGDFSCEGFEQKLKDTQFFSSSSSSSSSRFDIIISNPPYIPMEEYQKLHTSVKDYEPMRALISPVIDVKYGDKGDGLFHIQAVIRLAEKVLRPGGLLLIEHGYNQAEHCRALCDVSKWEFVSSGKDYGHIERYLRAVRRLG